MELFSIRIQRTFQLVSTAIAAKDVFDCYVHGSIGLIEVF